MKPVPTLHGRVTDAADPERSGTRVHPDADGSFLVRDVPPGRYVLVHRSTLPTVGEDGRMGWPRLLEIEQPVEVSPVPGGVTDEPLVLPPVSAPHR